MHRYSMKALALMLAAAGLSGCLRSVSPSSDGVPCVALKPRTDALRGALMAHPETPEAVGQVATDIVLGTDAVCG